MTLDIEQMMKKTIEMFKNIPFEQEYLSMTNGKIFTLEISLELQINRFDLNLSVENSSRYYHFGNI